MKIQPEKKSNGGWMVLLTTLLLFRISTYFMVSDQVAVTQLFKTGTRLLLTFITGCAFIYHRNRVLPVKHVNWLPVLAYGTYLSLGALSLFWTSGFHESLLQLAMDVETFVFVFFFMQVFYAVRMEASNGGLHRILAPAIFLTGIFFAAGLYLSPDLFYRLTHGGEVARLGGFIINPNELGMLLVVGITAFLYDFFKDGKLRIRNFLAIGILVWLLLLTGSRSSFIALMLVIAFYALSRPGKLVKISFLLAGFLIAVFTGYKVFVKMGDTAEVMSMTGRIPFWSDLLHYNFPKAPLLGYGYMRIDYSDKFESLNAYAGAMTHNTFLQVLLGLGLTGLLIVLVQMGLFFFAIIQNKDVVLRRFILLVFIPLLINSLTEFGIFGETNYGILFYLMLNFYAIQEPRFESRRIKRHVENTHQESGVPLRPGDAAQIAAA